MLPPLLAVAVAVSVMVAGAVKVAPLVGAVKLTVGGVFSAYLPINVLVSEVRSDEDSTWS